MKGARTVAIILALSVMGTAWSRESHAAESVKVDFVGSHEKRPLTLYYHQGWRTESGWAVPEWEPLCTAPCSSWLPAGQYRFAVSVPGGEPVGMDERVVLTEPTVLSGAYVSNRNVRIMGYGLMAAGPALGGFLWLPHYVGPNGHLSDTAKDERRVTKYAALGIAITGFLGGMIMTVIPDRTQIVVEPMDGLGSKDVAGASTLGEWLPVGLSASYRF